ncbi:MAG: hypothetical protein J1F16_03925 [Muribaculaceae bacterium]|nr:hypothetical protein [Muribaculaceae bacterium]
MSYDEDKDVFDNEREENDQQEEVKKPSYKPDDPEYWEQEESEWDHLKRRSRIPLWVWVLCGLAVVGLVIGCWIRYFSPYVEDATQYGYVEHIEKRGMIFKTYEGTLIPYKELMDTTRVYNRDFVFSVEDQKTAAKLKQALYDVKPIRVNYKKYYATVPWRGAHKIVVTSVDTVDPHNILPPEFAPYKP